MKLESRQLFSSGMVEMEGVDVIRRRLDHVECEEGGVGARIGGQRSPWHCRSDCSRGRTF
ncbi:hypothetical protein RchiOBHm_Chr3g0472931 [Rosa chinensis]|uniref:Uncharacterized protein n=1 Tax=Rosa chinensis TaxID=74649 RepID=A0A2P6RBQ5_ROSCH|nr:hypothetical protein RchiOBHm_Chr3g0472931 [Rosa chinensis]